MDFAVDVSQVQQQLKHILHPFNIGLTPMIGQWSSEDFNLEKKLENCSDYSSLKSPVTVCTPHCSNGVLGVQEESRGTSVLLLWMIAQMLSTFYC